MPAPTNERQALERERAELPGQIAGLSSLRWSARMRQRLPAEKGTLRCCSGFSSLRAPSRSIWRRSAYCRWPGGSGPWERHPERIPEQRRKAHGRKQQRLHGDRVNVRKNVRRRPRGAKPWPTPPRRAARVPGGSLDEDQDEQDGRQNQTQAHGDSLGDLVRLEFRPLGRGRHVADVHPSTSSRAARVARGRLIPVGRMCRATRSTRVWTSSLPPRPTRGPAFYAMPP